MIYDTLPASAFMQEEEEKKKITRQKKISTIHELKKFFLSLGDGSVAGRDVYYKI